MSNYIINDDHYYTIFSYHQNENSIKRYFEDEFNIEKKMLQKVNIFNKDELPELKAPPKGMFEAVFGGRTESQDNTEFDIDNAINLYEAMRINRVQAADKRLWAYLCHDPYFNFIKKRYTPQKSFQYYDINKYYEYDGQEQKTIKNYIETRFFTGTDNRTLGRNGISFYWWATELTHSPWDRYDGIDKRDDQYYYTKYVVNNPDIWASIFERITGQEPSIIFNLLDVIIENDLKRNQYRELVKKIRSDLHIFQYSMLASGKIKKRINHLLGTINT